MYTIDDEEEFDNLTQLVEHYEKDADGLVTRLRVPVAKEGKQNYIVEIDDFKKCEYMMPFIPFSTFATRMLLVDCKQIDGILLVGSLPSSYAIGLICKRSFPSIPAS